MLNDVDRFPMFQWIPGAMRMLRRKRKRLPEIQASNAEDFNSIVEDNSGRPPQAICDDDANPTRPRGASTGPYSATVGHVREGHDRLPVPRITSPMVCD
jgi:hypothetical protein